MKNTSKTANTIHKDGSHRTLENQAKRGKSGWKTSTAQKRIKIQTLQRSGVLFAVLWALDIGAVATLLALIRTPAAVVTASIHVANQWLGIEGTWVVIVPKSWAIIGTGFHVEDVIGRILANWLVAQLDDALGLPVHKLETLPFAA